MDRKSLAKYIRGLIDEFTEYPQGLIRDDSDEIDLDMLINVSIQDVALDLIPHIPHWFYKTFLISVSPNKREYDIVDDLGVEDYQIMKDILHNQSGEKPQGLLYSEIDQLHEYDIIVGETGDPIVWSYEGKNVIAFDPTPSALAVNRYKGIYWRKLPDLNKDDASDHDPANGDYSIPDLPEPAHVIVALDAAQQCHMIGEEESAEINIRKIIELKKFTANLGSIKPSFSQRSRSKLGESVR